MDDLKGLHPEQQSTIPKIGKVTLIGIVAMGILFTGGIAHAMFSGESLEEKIERLEWDYAQQTKIIEDADDVIEAAYATIEKQNDIKWAAEGSLMSISVDLSSAKVQREMEKGEEDRDLDEVQRLTRKANENAEKIRREIREEKEASETVGLE